jgi:hypothetical protein
MKNKFLLLVAAITLSTSGLFAANLSSNKVNAIAIHADATTKLTSEDIYVYLSDNGIQAVQIWQISGTENYGASDIKGIRYTVYVQNGIITGWDQSQF